MLMSLRKWLRGEGGVSEAATAIFVLPIIGTMIFLLVDVGFNIRTRTVIDSIVQDTARSAGLDGGALNARGTQLDTAVYTAGWSTVGTKRLVAACNAGQIRSTAACSTLKMTCTPARALNVGDLVTCKLTTGITYKTLSPLSTNPAFSLGMSGLFTTPIKVSVSSVASIGSNN